MNSASGIQSEVQNPTRWLMVWFAIGAGIMAATQVGMAPPALEIIQSELGISMITAGWVASVFNLLGATLGVAIGFAADHFDPRRCIAVSLALLFAGAMGGAWAPDVTLLLLARIAAGFGLLLVAVTAPIMIIANSAPNERALTLGVWSIFMPFGFAAGLLYTHLLLSLVSWRWAWSVNAVLVAIYFLLFLVSTRSRTVTRQAAVEKPRITMVLKTPGPWLLAGCFGVYTVMWFSLSTWLPAWLSASFHLSPGGIALASAGIIAANVIGNIGGARLLQRGIQRWRILWSVYITMGICAVILFSSAQEPAVRLLAAVIFSAAGGAIPASLFSASAIHAPTPASYGTVNGFIVQGSYTGILCGAPLLAWVFTLSGSWESSWILMITAASAGCVLTYILRAVEKRIQ